MSTSVTTTAALRDVPKLSVNGDNSVIFFIRFTRAVKSKGVWPHLDGSAACPRCPITTTGATGTSGTDPTIQGPATMAGTPPTDPAIAKYEEDLANWEKDEALALDLLTQRIPDSTVIRTSTLKTAAAMWAEIVHEYTEKGTMTQTDLRTRFLESKCSEKSDVRAFLDSLRVKREELAQAGVQIDEKDYRSTIIKSLPFHLSNFASSQLTAACLFSPTKTIDPDLLISVISEEYDRNQRGRETSRLARTFNGKNKDHDEALAITPSHPARRGNQNSKPSKKGPDCWNCGESGHIRRDCKKPKKRTSTDKPESANQVVDDSDDEAFGISDTESDTDSMPELVTVCDSEEEADGIDNEMAEDWFSDFGDDWETPCGMGYSTDELSGIDSEGSSFVDVDLESVSEQAKDLEIDQDLFFYVYTCHGGNRCCRLKWIQ